MTWAFFTAGVWGVFYLIEKIKPFRPEESFLRHDGVNLLFAAIGSVLLSGLVYILGSPLINLFPGLLQIITFPFWVETLMVFLLLDLWMYFWHRVNHRLPWLWHFHRIHHSDLFLNASSSFRFHFAEVMISFLVRVPVLALIGLSLDQLLIYETLFRIWVTFHHSNIALPKRVDDLLQRVLVSPNMHRVHHSKLKSETDSNYSSIFSFWDRLFQSFSKREELSKIEYGLDFGQKQNTQNIIRLLKSEV